MVPSLTSEVVAGESNEINYMSLSFSAIAGNCSVQHPSHPTLPLWIPAS